MSVHRSPSMTSRVKNSSGHAHGASQQCACTQGNPTHPFTIDCNDAATIRAATTTLETTCTTANTYEWGGIFSTPANAYKWVAQAKGSPRAWADPSMKLVVFASDCVGSRATTATFGEPVNGRLEPGSSVSAGSGCLSL